MDEDHEQITDSIPAELLKKVFKYLSKNEKMIENDPKAEEKITFEIIRMSLNDERERIMEFLLDYKGWTIAKRSVYKKNTKQYHILSGAITMISFIIQFVESGEPMEGGMFDENSELK